MEYGIRFEEPTVNYALCTDGESNVKVQITIVHNDLIESVHVVLHVQYWDIPTVSSRFSRVRMYHIYHGSKFRCSAIGSGPWEQLIW